MYIHILPSVGNGGLKNSIIQSITSSGHEAGELENSEYVIGLTDDRDWQKVQGFQGRIILKEPRKVDTVPSTAILVNAHMLTLIDNPTTTLADWLRTAPQPVSV